MMMPDFRITAMKDGEALTASRTDAAETLALCNDLLEKGYLKIRVQGPDGKTYEEDDLPSLIDEQD